MLFNIVTDASHNNWAHKNYGQVKRVVQHLVDHGLSILQYVDDIILFTEHDLEKVRIMKLKLLAFKKPLGLEIHFHIRTWLNIIHIDEDCLLDPH
jgi:hypothetical protein